MMIRLPRPSVDVTDFNRHTLSANEKFCREDLERSGLTPEDIPVFAEPLKEVTSAFARGLPDEKERDLAYFIPYYFANGEPVLKPEGSSRMWRMRTTNLEFRYMQPSRADVGELSTMPYFCPLRLEHGHKNGLYVVVEGEKKYAKLLKEEGLYGCAIGGKDNWRGAAGGLHPLIVEDIAAYAPETILIVPDGDWHRQDIFASYSLLVFKLRIRFPDVVVRLADLSGFHAVGSDERMGVDDYLVVGLAWADVPVVDLEHELLLPTDVLIERFGLEFKTTRDGVRKLLHHASNIEKILRLHPMFNEEILWYNLDEDSPLFQDSSDNVSERVLVAVQRYCHLTEVSKSHVRDALVIVFKQRERSPFATWLKSLKWDGVERIEKGYARECLKAGVREEEPYRAEACKRLFLQMVARSLSPGCKCDTVVVFVGPQGSHKTTHWEVFSRESFAVLPEDISDKDSMMVIHRKRVIIAEEMNYYRGKAVATFKDIVSRTEDTYRSPYRDRVESKKRKNIIVGNTNDEQFMREAENRRLMPIWVEDIDIGWLRGNIEGLYAEAVARYEGGEQWWDEDESRWEESKEWARAEVPNRLAIENAIEQIIKNGDAHVIGGMTYVEVAVIDLWLNASGIRMRTNDIGGALKLMGWKHERPRIPGGRQLSGWRRSE
jgi:hypothetical protein